MQYLGRRWATSAAHCRSSMARLDNHYEAAFQRYLRAHRVPYVAVDEGKRSLAAGGSLKNLDFIVAPTANRTWLVDVKGRRFPSGRRKQYWKNWSTQDDLESLARWQHQFGRGFRGLFVFAYNIRGDRAPVSEEKLFVVGKRLYAFVGIRFTDYVAHARTISPRWRTVSIPTPLFRRLARPIDDFLLPPSSG